MKNEINVRDDVDINVLSALKNTLYPGASDESIDLVLSYCKALQLDPMQKPVHLVHMSVKDSQGRWVKRLVVMPGIGLYRIQASRSGSYAGVSEPEFGEEVTEKIGFKQTTYPKWCKVTVKKKLGDIIVEFSAKEYWKENYADSGKKDGQADISPNNIWEKRPYGQLAKCAEAQALRKAFPGIISSLPTAEEMEGKAFEVIKDIKDITPNPSKVKEYEPKPSDINRRLTEFTFTELDGSRTKSMFSDEVLGYMSDKIQSLHSETDLELYRQWQSLNKELIKIYFKENRADMNDLMNSFKAAEGFIKRDDNTDLSE